VELKPAPVTVSRAVLTAFDDDTASVSITCSSGFYVRSFAHELGRRLGCGACLESLRRTRSGEFTLDRAVPIDVLANAKGSDGPVVASRLLPLEAVLPEYPAVQLTADGVNYVSNGRDLGPRQLTGRLSPTAAWVRLMDANGALIALAEPAASGLLHPSIVLL
jgi:tRNA pseudouridine55 synthase